MKSFSQRDARWSSMLLGDSDLTIGRYGCTTTCIADLSTYFGGAFDPAEASRKIKYTKDGLVIWASCKFLKFGFWFRQYGRNDRDIKNALADPNVAVILNVAGGSHWVVASGKPSIISMPNNYKIADPWLGDFSTMARYKGNITGAAYFRRV